MPAFASVDELVEHGDPEFVLVAVPVEVASGITADLVRRGVRVLEETPPALDAPAMRRMWDEVGDSGLVQVADQSLFMPAHSARWRAVRSGVIGTPTHVQVCSNHLYHAVSIMRGLLGDTGDATRVSARDLRAPLLDPLTTHGWTDETEARERTTTLATLDFGGGRSGLYDFVDNQWFSPLRHRRLTIRGSHGEIDGDSVVRMAGPRSVVESRITRRQTGIDHNLEGFHLDSIALDGDVLFRNPHPGARQSDEDIAVDALVGATGAWARGEGPAPYPLADGLQDHLLGQAIRDSADSGVDVTTAREPWADALTTESVFR
ncbi:gfo/Idh/MocA family oxidoreductase [Rathayibacter sp. ZW T2_19]|uniref:Gfo/Idh/MocA family oxidoreductase n=1 Tax=Rathayibacter rubneri TaxID=2950106 RepID=A0A9X2IVI0_9MICO|nr:gfo/Idh/MocA family oxidoreductase [Rathayibacter rubneri]MCM6763634.1 gfo/Idh/MocA family oxidoreductase [Rathayibacter rubneri]